METRCFTGSGNKPLRVLSSVSGRCAGADPGVLSRGSKSLFLVIYYKFRKAEFFKTGRGGRGVLTLL